MGRRYINPLFDPRERRLDAGPVNWWRVGGALTLAACGCTVTLLIVLAV